MRQASLKMLITNKVWSSYFFNEYFMEKYRSINVKWFLFRLYIMRNSLFWTDTGIWKNVPIQNHHSTKIFLKFRGIFGFNSFRWIWRNELIINILFNTSLNSNTPPSSSTLAWFRQLFLESVFFFNHLTKRSNISWSCHLSCFFNSVRRKIRLTII